MERPKNWNQCIEWNAFQFLTSTNEAFTNFRFWKIWVLWLKDRGWAWMQLDKFFFFGAAQLLHGKKVCISLLTDKNFLVLEGLQYATWSVNKNVLFDCVWLLLEIQGQFLDTVTSNSSWDTRKEISKVLLSRTLWAEYVKLFGYANLLFFSSIDFHGTDTSGLGLMYLSNVSLNCRADFVYKFWMRRKPKI